MLASCLACADGRAGRRSLASALISSLGRAAGLIGAGLVIDHGSNATEADEASRLVLIFIGAPCAAYHAFGVFPGTASHGLLLQPVGVFLSCIVVNSLI